MDTATAIGIALEALDSKHVSTSDASSARERLVEVLTQRGCEDLDPAVTDGRLTTFCDIVIDG